MVNERSGRSISRREFASRIDWLARFFFSALNRILGGD